MRYFLILIALIIAGCTSGHPVPEVAFKACLDAGGTPSYTSNSNHTTFKCEGMQ